MPQHCTRTQAGTVMIRLTSWMGMALPPWLRGQGLGLLAGMTTVGCLDYKVTRGQLPKATLLEGGSVEAGSLELPGGTILCKCKLDFRSLLLRALMRTEFSKCRSVCLGGARLVCHDHCPPVWKADRRHQVDQAPAGPGLRGSCTGRSQRHGLGPPARPHLRLHPFPWHVFI